MERCTVSLDSIVSPGKEYSISANVKFTSGGKKDTFYMKLQYSDADGKVNYSPIAEGETEKDVWIQLAEKNYTVPEDASDIQLYIETAESKNNFYVDEVIIADAGTDISGAGTSGKITRGDLNFDSAIDVFDMIEERKVIIDGTENSALLKAADIDGNGTPEINDLVLLDEFLIGKTDEFPEPPEPPKPDNKWDDYVETDSSA